MTFAFGYASFSGSTGAVDTSLAGYNYGSAVTVCTWFWLVRTGQDFSLVSNGERCGHSVPRAESIARLPPPVSRQRDPRPAWAPVTPSSTQMRPQTLP